MGARWCSATSGGNPGTCWRSAGPQPCSGWRNLPTPGRFAPRIDPGGELKMTDILEGVRVLEVAFWTFVPSAGAILSDWGADVIKIEHPETGDPQRGLTTMGVMPGGAAAVNFMI